MIVCSIPSPPPPRTGRKERPAHLQDIDRARELLEANGLGYLRPDKAWRPRSWVDRIAAVPMHEEELVESVAEAIYRAHWQNGLPTWKTTSDEHREWSRVQARAALSWLRALERGSK